MLPDYKSDCRNDYYETTVTNLGQLYISFLEKNGYSVYKWISVDEGLPEKYETVLISLDNNTVLVDTYTEMGWKINQIDREYRRVLSKVTAWMPIPKAYHE